jgi:hypothetical protein
MGYLMTYEVRVRPSARKSIERALPAIQEKFEFLLQVLRTAGPTGPFGWRNYGKLKGSRKSRYHCHLASDHSYVACWEWHKGALLVEVYYAGTHKDAPY